MSSAHTADNHETKTCNAKDAETRDLVIRGTATGYPAPTEPYLAAGTWEPVVTSAYGANEVLVNAQYIRVGDVVLTTLTSTADWLYGSAQPPFVLPWLPTADYGDEKFYAYMDDRPPGYYTSVNGIAPTFIIGTNENVPPADEAFTPRITSSFVVMYTTNAAEGPP